MTHNKNQKSMFRALKHRNFRLFFFGQTISLIGTWMQTLARSWLIYEMTHSSFWVGVVMFAENIPSLFLPLVAGVWLDRQDKRKILIWVQGLMMVCAFALAALDYSGHILVWHIVLLSLFNGFLVATEIPSRHAFVGDMIDGKEDLGNAIALMAMTFNGSRLIGPAIAGLVLAATSPGICFLINGVSFLAVIWGLWAMRVPAPKLRANNASNWDNFKEGWRYIVGFEPIRNLLVFVAISTIAFSSTSALLPEFAAKAMGGDAKTLGWLQGAMGFGTFLATIFLARRSSVVGLGRYACLGMILTGVSCAALPFAPNLPLALMAMLGAGLGLVTQLASSNSIIQTIVDPDKKGRVMSFYTVALVGVMPLGSVLFGWLGTSLGVKTSFFLSGLLFLAGGFAFLAWLPAFGHHTRPIFAKLNLIPQEDLPGT